MKRIRVAVPVFLPLFAWLLWAEEIRLGKPIDVNNKTAIRDLLASPENYLGKDIRIEGEITEVCQMMGCWINVRDASSEETLTVKVDDNVIVFPKDGVGKTAIAQGRLERIVLNRDQYIAYLKHEAEETGRTIDTSKITEGKTIYRIRGLGAVIH